MSYELHDLDRNCNDCKCLVRDFARYKEALDRLNANNWAEFERERNRLLEINKPETIAAAKKMKYQKQSVINEGYGFCTKFQKDVDFIPATCQIHTQHCFEHRREK